MGPDGKPLASAEQVQLPPDQLDDYVGRYTLAPQAVLSITLDGAQLMAQLTGQPPLPIFAEKADRFFYRVVDAQIDFERDASGKVVSLTLHQNGRDLKFTREN